MTVDTYRVSRPGSSETFWTRARSTKEAIQTIALTYLIEPSELVAEVASDPKLDTRTGIIFESATGKPS